MKTLVAALILSASLSIASLCFAAPKTGTVVKNADLPASVKAAPKAARKHDDGIPLCTVGRMVGDWGLVSMADFDRMAAAGHPCISSDTIYVCRAGRNLSVRCE